ncbi:MAG: type II toxin-antitoxin system prevent-host-death family antitoxin [Deltaproteobacteria bacterium]|nr:type II toxin-antitoxin system prevent-host-death family antitoxin [Deltaproteobacteria bacterium]
MRAVTIKEAKAHLNELVEAAERGDQVVIMRGSTHVAAIVPVSAAEIELPSRLTDLQAERFWRALAVSDEAGSTRVFGSPTGAVRFLSSGQKSVRRRPRPKR